MDLGVPELLIILVLVVLLFGVGRIGKVAGELGSGIRAFREGLQGKDEEDQANASRETPASPTAAAPKEAAPVEQVIVEEVSVTDDPTHPSAS